MSAGHTWSSECRLFRDDKTKVQIRQLTDYKGHSHHFYFTQSGWYDKGRKLLFSSDRNNRCNLFSIDLPTGMITQLTDLEPIGYSPDKEPCRETEFMRACLNLQESEVYFWRGRVLTALDLKTLEIRDLYEMSNEYWISMVNCTADGNYVCAGMNQILPQMPWYDIFRSFKGGPEYFKNRLSAKIELIAVDGTGSKTIWEEPNFINHINTSPTHPHLLTFCHEGEWNLVDHRIWGLNIETAEVWKIRPRTQDGESVGHEYWHADGDYIGYHGSRKTAGRTSFFIGHIRYDNADMCETESLRPTGHVHSNNRSYVAGDGGGAIRIWTWNGHGYDRPRLLCYHHCTFKIQQLHVHPRISPDNSKVLFTSDMSGYGNLYLADIHPRL